MTYIIAEAGVNHNGDLNKAHQLIDAAADAGAHAVKFQTYRADELAVAGPHRDMLAKYQMPLEWYPELQEHACVREIDFSSSAFDEESADFLASLGVPWIKIPSGENRNFELFKAIKSHGLPVYISNGMGGLSDEILSSLSNEDIVLECVSNYPAKISDYDLFPSYKMYEKGISDHTLGDTMGIVAASLGCRLYEKHITLNRDDDGPDHKASMEPCAFKDMVDKMRAVAGATRKHPLWDYPIVDAATIPRARRVETPEGFKRNP